MASTTPDSAIQILCAGAQLETQRRPDRPHDELWLTAEELQQVSGWQLKPEGLCKDGACAPLGEGAGRYLDGELVCASGLWRELNRPLQRDAACSTWVLGEAAEDRAAQLESLQAPDFTLPDIEGKLHSLSDFRGQKVLLATWASW